VKILRDAFATMFKDRDFQQDVDKLGWNDELIRGDELNKKVDGLVHNEIGDGLFSKNIAIASFRADPSFWLAFFFAAALPYWSGPRLAWTGIRDSSRGQSEYPPWRWPCAGFLPIGGAPARMLSQGKQRGMSESSIFRLIAAFRRRKCFDIQSGTAYWILTFACGIWFLGFLIAIPLFIFFYLISEANAGKFSAAIVAGLTSRYSGSRSCNDCFRASD